MEDGEGVDTRYQIHLRYTISGSFVYYQVIKLELNGRLIYECLCTQPAEVVDCEEHMNETFVKTTALELQRCVNLKWNNMYDVLMLYSMSEIKMSCMMWQVC